MQQAVQALNLKCDAYNCLLYAMLQHVVSMLKDKRLKPSTAKYSSQAQSYGSVLPCPNP